MAEFLVKFFILLVGFGLGFMSACVAAARIIAEKNDAKCELAKANGELDQLKNYNKDLFDENQNLKAVLASHKIPTPPTFTF